MLTSDGHFKGHWIPVPSSGGHLEYHWSPVPVVTSDTTGTGTSPAAASPPVGNWAKFAENTTELREQGTVLSLTRLHWIMTLADGLAPKDSDKFSVMSYRARLSEKQK